MSGFDGTLLWCVGQVSLLAAMGVLAAMCLTRRAPSAAASGCVFAVVSIIAVTALAPVELPSFEAMEPVEESSANVGSAMHPPALTPSRSRAEGNGGINVALLLRQLSRALSQAADEAPRAAPRTFEAGVWIATIAVAAGGLRLLIACVWVWQLRRGSMPVGDAGVLSAFDDICTRMNLQRRPALWETAALASPAVIGWRRRIVMLPTNRVGWDERQLRATLAHELAHVVRGDFEWRLAASVVRAVHFFNPLAHWLARRLALAQELAADRMAAAATGGSMQYATALAGLALKLDRPQRMRSDAILLPVFSSNLSRRLTMLRSTDGSVQCRTRSLAGMAAGCAIVLAAVMTTALRGRADATAAETAVAVAERPPFIAPAPDLSFFAPVDIGLIVLQTDDLAKMREFSVAVALAEEFFRSELDGLRSRGLVDPPKVNLKSIDFVAYAMRRTTAAEVAMNPILAPGAAQDGTSLMPELAVRWVEAVDVVAWMGEHVPEAQIRSENGLRYVQVKVGDEEGAAFYLAQRDLHTVVASYSIDRLRELTAKKQDEDVAPSDAWQAIGGGLLSFRINPAAIPEGTVELLRDTPLSMFTGKGAGTTGPDPFKAAEGAICDATIEMCAGVDFNPATREVSLRSSFMCRDSVGAEKVSGSIEMYQAIAKAVLDAYQNELSANPEAFDSTDPDVGTYIDGMMAGLRMMTSGSIKQRLDENDGSEVWIEMSGELPMSVRNLISGEPGVITPLHASTPSATQFDQDKSVPTSATELREALNPGLLGGGKQGLFVLRPSELAQRPAIAPVIQLANRLLRQELQGLQGVRADAVPEFHLDEIEYVAGDCAWQIRQKAGDDGNEKGMMMASQTGVVVKFCNAAPGLERIAAMFDGAELTGEGDAPYLTLPPVIPAFGPEQLCVALRDEQTLVIALGKEDLDKFMSPQPHAMSPAAAKSWEALSSSLAAVVADVEVLPASGEPLAEPAVTALTNRLIAETQRLEASFDLDLATNEAELQLALGIQRDASADAVLGTVSELVSTLEPMLQAMIDSPVVEIRDGTEREKMNLTAGGPDTDRQVGRFWMDVLHDCELSIVEFGDDEASVRATVRTQFPRSILRAYEVAEAPTAEVK